MRRTKVVATLGPATDDPRLLRRLLRAGVDVVRLNLSHGTHAEHARRIRAVRRVAQDIKRPIGILLDLSGWKPRLGEWAGGPRAIREGDQVIFTTGHATADAIPFPARAASALRPRRRFFVADGAFAFRVQRVQGTRIVARAVQDAELRPRMGIFVPDLRVRNAVLTDKDRRDLRFAIRHRREEHRCPGGP